MRNRTDLKTMTPPELFGVAVLKNALKLEIKGIKMVRGGPSAYKQLKEDFSLKGNKQKVYDQVVELYDAEMRRRGIDD